MVLQQVGFIPRDGRGPIFSGSGWAGPILFLARPEPARPVGRIIRNGKLKTTFPPGNISPHCHFPLYTYNSILYTRYKLYYLLGEGGEALITHE